MADEPSLLKNSHFWSGYDTGRATLEAENARLRDVADVVRKHYPTIAGHVLRLQEAHEERAATEWLAVAQDFYNALERLDA